MKAYYNDNDSRIAQWLQDLVAAGKLPEGDVDDRSIADVQPGDLTRYRQVHLFAGIGGWPLALQLAGWPPDRDVWSGSCPCQPLSAAGRREGETDKRHLWPHFRRLIAECKPATVFGEQVASDAGRIWLSGVRADLEALGYAVGAADLCAASIGAPHIRQRIFWVADAQYAQRRAEYPGDVASHWWDGLGRCGEGLANAERGAAERQRFDLAGETRSPEGRAQERQRLRPDTGHGRPGLGEPNPGRCEEQWEPVAAEAPRASAEHPGIGLDDTTGDGAGRGREARPGRDGQDDGLLGPTGAWARYRWADCADGKRRRYSAEPGDEPLAARVPGRLVLLRGYGNSIVPQVAAAFVRAYLAARQEGI